MSRWTCAGLVLLTLLVATPAQAFLLVATDQGVPTRWHQQCVPWKMSERVNNGLGWSETHALTTAAFETWDELEGTYIRFEDQGTSSLDSVSLDHGVGENIIIWHGDGQWPYALHVVGLTSLTYDTDTGQIMDADIEMNADLYRFAVDGDPEAYDAQQALTHEIGHLLGLDHSSNPEAVMFAESEPGETYKRVLQADDIEGLKFSHPLMATPEVDGCVAPVVVTRPEDDGCASGGASGTLLWCLPLALLWTFRRRSRAQILTMSLALAAVTTGEVHVGTQYVTESGVPIFWPEDTMLYTLHPDLPEELNPDAVESAINFGFNAWEGLECQPLTLDFAGWEGCVGDNSEDGINCIRWRNRQEVWSWAHHLVAVTLVHYREDTGVIVDADMEINAFNTSWSTSLECEPDLHDLIATITHEVGHFVGLDHSQNGQATMNAATTTGDCQKRSLEQDDIETFCATYEDRPELPVETDGDASSWEPDAGGAGDVASEGDATADISSPGSGGGCQSCSGGPTEGWLSLLGLTAWLRSRRRSRRGAGHAPAR